MQPTSKNTLLKIIGEKIQNKCQTVTHYRFLWKYCLCGPCPVEWHLLYFVKFKNNPLKEKYKRAFGRHRQQLDAGTTRRRQADQKRNMDSPYDEKTVVNSQELSGACEDCWREENGGDRNRSRILRYFFATVFLRSLWASCVNALLKYHGSSSREFGFLDSLTDTDLTRRPEFLVAMLEEVACEPVDCSAFNLYVSSFRDLHSLLRNFWSRAYHDADDYDYDNDDSGEELYDSSLLTTKPPENCGADWEETFRRFTRAVGKLGTTPTERQVRDVMAAFRLLSHVEKSRVTPGEKKATLSLSEEGKRFLTKRLPVGDLLANVASCPATALAFLPFFDWAKRAFLRPGETLFCTENSSALDGRIAFSSFDFASAKTVQVGATIGRCGHKVQTESVDLLGSNSELSLRCTTCDTITQCEVTFPRELLIFGLLLRKFLLYVHRGPNDKGRGGCDRELLFASVLYDITRKPRSFETFKPSEKSLAEIARGLKNLPPSCEVPYPYPPSAVDFRTARGRNLSSTFKKATAWLRKTGARVKNPEWLYGKPEGERQTVATFVARVHACEDRHASMKRRNRKDFPFREAAKLGGNFLTNISHTTLQQLPESLLEERVHSTRNAARVSPRPGDSRRRERPSNVEKILPKKKKKKKRRTSETDHSDENSDKEEEPKAGPSNKIEKISPKAKKRLAARIDHSDSDESSDEEEESKAGPSNKIEKISPKAKKRLAARIDHSDSDESSDEEEKPKAGPSNKIEKISPKAKKRLAARIHHSDSDESSDEEEEPKVGPSKKIVIPKKKKKFCQN